MTKTQTVTQLMNDFNPSNGIIEYQLLFIAFADFIGSDEVNDVGQRMFIGHALENFLRSQGLKKTLTINDLNILFDQSMIAEKIDDEDMYKNLLMLIYEELTSNEKTISYKIQEAISTVLNVLNQKFLGADAPVAMPIERDMPRIEVPTTQSMDISMPQFTNIPAPEIKINPVSDVPFPLPKMSNNNTEPIIIPAGMQVNDENIIKEQPPTPDCFNCDKKYSCDKPEKIFIPVEEEKVNTMLNNLPPLNNNNNKVEDELPIPNSTTEIRFNNYNKKFIREVLIAKNLIPYKCAICGIGTWQNNPLPLELDIKDFSKNNLDNYRFLCPNCYSQYGCVDK